MAGTRTYHVNHRATRRGAEKYIASFVDVLGETTEWTGRQSVPILLTWTPVKAEAGGFDIVGTVTYLDGQAL